MGLATIYMSFFVILETDTTLSVLWSPRHLSPKSHGDQGPGGQLTGDAFHLFSPHC